MRFIRMIGLLCLLAGGKTLSAQPPQAQLGPAFPVPSDGWDKLLQLQNGNTLYLHFGKKGGVITTMYNKEREITAQDTLREGQCQPGNLETAELDGIYEINGQPVVFLQQLINEQPVLFRLLLDAQTGKLLQEDQLAMLPTIRHKSVFVQNNLASHDCYVEKDPASGYYAVATFTGSPVRPEDTTARERIHVMHFSPRHELLRQAYYYLPDTAFTYFSYIAMTVQGADKLYLATVGFNQRRKGEEPVSKVIFSALGADSATFAHRFMPYSSNFGEVSGNIQYVPALQRLQFLLYATGSKSISTPAAYLNFMQPDSATLDHYRLLSWPKLNAYTQQNMGYKTDFTGTPQQLHLQRDGSNTLLLENLSHFAQGNSEISRLHTNMGDIGMVKMDTSGTENTALALPKWQVITGRCEPFYQHRRTKGEWVFRNKIAALNTNTFLSYDFVDAPHGLFFFFNDYLQYLEGGGEQRRKPLKFMTDANFVCYRYAYDKWERTFPFGIPAADKNYYCMLGAGTYDTEKRIYATVMISGKEGVKQAQVAWITF